MPLPLLQKLLGHSSVRTTALYWRDIYSKDEVGDILVGKKWLEQSPLAFDKDQENKEQPKTPPIIEENSPEPLLKNSDSDIVKDKPLITTEKPNDKNNSLLNTENEKNLAIANYQPKPLASEIPPKNHRWFSLTSEPLPVITDGEQSTSKEQVLLVRIKQLERQLAKVREENTHLKLENKHLKALIRKEQETEAKIIQSLPLKIKN